MNEAHYKLLMSGVNNWNKWRSENPDILPDLRFADLSKRDLPRVNFHRAVLVGANFSNCNLENSAWSCADVKSVYISKSKYKSLKYKTINIGSNKYWHVTANFDDANLTGANLSAANLREASLRQTSLINANLGSVNLSGVNLTNAQLKNARLAGANLTRADLTNANFENTIMNSTVFCRNDISRAKNLESIIHNGPSVIDQETLMRSGRLPDDFLKGIGLSQHFIDYIPALFWVKNAIEFYSCFISYSHQERAFARRLHNDLQTRGIRCWLDEKQVLPGDDIYEQIDHGIRNWDKVLLCCSENSLTSWWVDNEIDSAFEKERQLTRQRGKKVLALVPIDLDGYLFSDTFESGKKRQLLSRITADFRGWGWDNTNYERAFEQVVKALRTDNGTREKPPQRKL